jgi:hypothetical protein
MSSQMAVTLVLLSILSVIFLKGFKEAINIAVVLVGVYLALMKKVLVTVGLVTTLMLASAIGRVRGQQDQSKGKVLFASADQANFHDTGNGVAMAPIWGDSE